MKKWYDEEYEWEIEVIGFNKDNEEPERFCRNGEEIGDKDTCTYGCPVNEQGQGICSKSNDDDVSYHRSCQKWWRFRKYRWGIVNTVKLLCVQMVVFCLELQQSR